MRRLLLAVTLQAVFLACAAPTETAESGQDAVVIDTTSEAAKAQHAANVTFARSYVARCAATTGRKRVLLAGFGRVYDLARNPAGMMVTTLVPSVRYPDSKAPGGDRVDPPEAQLSVGVGSVNLATVGEVDVCAMVLPAAWDLTAVLVAKEIDSFKPDLVIENGIATPNQRVWLELGAVNRALPDADESGVTRPFVAPGETYAPLLPNVALGDQQGLLLSYAPVRAAAERALAKEVAASPEFGRIAHGLAFPLYPRPSGNFLCNNLSYVVSHLMSHPGESVTLMQSSTAQASGPAAAKDDGVAVSLAGDFTRTPRVFVHWPSAITGKHVARGARVMASMIDAQLDALGRGESPVVGQRSMADIDPSKGAF